MRNFILLVVLFTFTAVSAAQTQPGGFLVPIDMDDPYKLDLSFINNLTGDMYGRKFVPEKSAIWHGAHINDDPDEHRVAILVETDTGQIVVPQPAEHITFEELGRFPVTWLPAHEDTFIQVFTDPYTGDALPPLELSTFEYVDAVAVKYYLADGTTRIVAGFTSTIDVVVLSPTSYAAHFVVENFWPMKRFFVESQALSYTSAFANDAEMAQLFGFDPQTVVTGDNCASITDPIDAALCYCLNELAIRFQTDLDNCAFPPGGFTSALQGGGAGFAVGAVGGSLWSKFVKRISGAVGAGVVIGTTIAGTAAGYKYEVRACKTRARSKYNRDWNIAQNRANQARSQGTPFVCPSGNQ